MNSIFEKSSNDLIIDRINKLTPDAKAIWGKMSVAQMCKHCTVAIDIAFGKQNLKINFFQRLIGKMLRKKMLYGGDFTKNSPTAKELIIIDHLDLVQAKGELISKFSCFASEGKSSIKLMKHPFWGEMNYQEWDILMWKHLDHHLKQFGV